MCCLLREKLADVLISLHFRYVLMAQQNALFWNPIGLYVSMRLSESQKLELATKNR